MKPRDRSALAGEPRPDDAAENLPAESGVSGEAAPPAEAAPSAAPEAGDPAIDYRDRWLRTEADLQNYRRRAQRELEDARRDAEQRVMLDLITAIDDLERALAAGREAQAPESWVQGVGLVAGRMGEALARRGVSVIEALGEPFDPAYHEAMLEVPAPPGAAPGSVVEVVLKGYRRGDRVLRPARVVVARRDATAGE